MSSKLQSAVVAVLVSAGLLVFPTASVAGPGMVPPNVGVTFHALWEDHDDATRTAVFDKLVAAKVGWIRVDMLWLNLEEAGRGKINKAYLDRTNWVLDQARARGIKVLAILGMAPKWANGVDDPTVPPKDFAEYARVAKWAAKTFRGRVAAWEIWNEPNSELFFAGDAAAYASLVRTAYPAFKAGDPGATVVAGSTAYNDTKWLTEAYDAGMGGFFDALSTHPYMGPSNAPPELADTGVKWRMDHVRAVRQLMVDRGDEAKPIWFTEIGWTTMENIAGTLPWELGVSEADQADYLVRALRQTATQYPYVSHVFWYNERDNNSGHRRNDNAGLLRRDLSEKPAYQALKFALDPAAAPPSTTTTSTVVRPSSSPVPERATPAELVRRIWWAGFLVPVLVGGALRSGGRSGPFAARARRRLRLRPWN
jgi:hypothetical protein